MGRSSSFQLKQKARILNYPSNSWNSLSVDNKLKVWTKVYDKEVPSKTENKTDVTGDLTLLQVMKRVAESRRDEAQS